MADIGELAIFMWNVAGAPPNRTGAPGRTIWAMVMPASTSAVWKTVAPTTVTGAMRPISVTGTISTAIPASTQSMRFWHESSLYRKLPVAVIVKIDIGRAMRSARSARKSCIISTIRGHAVLGEGARHDRLLRVRQGHVQAPGVGHAGLDVVVGREGRGEVRDVGEAVAEPDVLDEVGRVREARLAGPVVEHLEARRARARNGPGRHRCRRAASPSRSYSQNDDGADAIAASTTSRGNRTRSPVASVGSPWSSSRRRISLPRTSIPTSARTRIASSTIRPMSSSSRMWSDGRMRAPRVGAVMVGISVPARRAGRRGARGARGTGRARPDGPGWDFDCLSCRA